MKSHIAVGVLIGVAALPLGGCGAKNAEAPKVGVEASGLLSVRSFEPQDLVFEDQTQFFMWKEDATDESVATVLRNAEVLEDEYDEVYLRSREQDQLRARFDAIGVDATELASLEAEDADSREALARKKADAEELRTQIARLAGQPVPADLAKKLQRLERDISRLQEKVDQVEEGRKRVKDAGMEKEYGRWQELKIELTAHQENARAHLTPIGDRVSLFDSTQIQFGFWFLPEGSIGVRIRNWDLSQNLDPQIAEEGSPTEYSTELGTVRAATYSRLGGAFTFEAETPHAVYHFKLARTKYGAKDGRVHYKGDVVRCGVSKGGGRPVVIHVRDFVRCGVSPGGSGVATLRRGVVSLNGLPGKFAQP